MRFKCSGIKYCEYYHPDLFSICDAYNRVDIHQLKALQQQVEEERRTLPIRRLKIATEAYVSHMRSIYY